MKLKIRTKLLIYFILLMAIPLSIQSFYSYSKSRAALQQQQEAALDIQTKGIAEEINNSLERNLERATFNAGTNRLINLADDLTGLGTNLDKDAVDASSLLTKLVADGNGTFEDAFIIDKTGKVIVDGQGGKNIGTDLGDRQYFKVALGGNPNFSDVLISRISGETVVCTAVPVYNQKKEIGAVLTVVTKFSAISKHAAEKKIGKTGYAYMIDKNGLLVYHPKKEKILKENIVQSSVKELAEVAKKMAGGAEGHGFYTYEGIYKYLGYAPVGNWAVAVTIPVEEYMKAADDIKKSSGIIFIIFLLAGIGVAVTVSLQISRPIEQLMKLMKRAENGDLTVESAIKRQDEIGFLGNSFNNMITGQNHVIREVMEAALTVAASSQTLSSSVEESNASIEEISSSVQLLSQGMEQNAASVEETGAAIQEVAANAQTVADSSQKAREKSNLAQEKASQGGMAVEEAVKAMSMIEQGAASVTNEVRELYDTSKQINMITNTITDIASQTNLLALNAAIEAARAGEQGRGFAVVAEEVRKLAEESSRAAGEIGELVKTIQNKTKLTWDKMGETANLVGNGTNLANEAKNHLSQIIMAINDVSSLIESIAAAAQEQSASSEEIASAITVVTEATMEAAGGAESISASTVQQTATIEEIGVTSQELANMAIRLEALLSKFQIHIIEQNCWEVKQCSNEQREKCPAYNSDEKRCWLIPGTWCGGAVQGDEQAKRNTCMNCEFFKNSIKH